MLPVTIAEVWHNSFAPVPNDPLVDNRVKSALKTAGASMATLNASVLGVDHGNQLRIRALQLGLPLNQPSRPARS